MLLINTSAGGNRLINPDYIVQIQPRRVEGLGTVMSEITLSDGTIIATDTPFGELARDLFTKKFVGRV